VAIQIGYLTARMWDQWDEASSEPVSCVSQQRRPARSFRPCCGDMPPPYVGCGGHSPARLVAVLVVAPQP
jgi:hypothetical protein